MATNQIRTTNDTAQRMKTPAILLLAITIFSVTTSAADTGDLQVRSVEYAASSNRLVATIYNQAQFTAKGPILVYFYDGDRKIGEKIYAEDIPRYSIVSVYIDHALSPGQHEFKAVVDPLNSVQETTESNNDRSVSVIYEPNDTVVVIAPSAKAEAGAPQEEKSPGSLSLYAGAALLAAAVIAMLLLKARSRGEKREERRPAARENNKTEKEKPAPEKTAEAREQHADSASPGGLMKIRDIIGMPRGTNVRFRAQISYHGKIGKDYAYFLKDETEEIVGFSKEEIRKTEGVISGTADRFLGENTSVQMEKVE